MRQTQGNGIKLYNYLKTDATHFSTFYVCLKNTLAFRAVCKLDFFQPNLNFIQLFESQPCLSTICYGTSPEIKCAECN
jgi:hypothetical protein